MTSIIDPNLSRLKCIGYKYGYDDVFLEDTLSPYPYFGIIFIKDLDFNNIAEYYIRMPFEVIEEYTSTNNFDIIANYVEKDLKNQHEKSKHYV